MKPRTTPIFPPETKSSLLKAIEEAAAPLKPAQLAKSIEFPHKLTGPNVKELLADELTAGRVFNWGSDKSPLYWHHQREAEARDRLLKIAGQEALTKAQLAARAAKQPSKIGPIIVKSVLDGLIMDRRLCVAPKTRRIMHAQAYLEAEIADLLKSCGWERPTGRIQALLAPEPETAPEPTPTTSFRR